MHSILVKDYMDRNPHAIPVDASVAAVVKELVSAQISGAPVIDNDKNLIGFVSEHDCIHDLLNDAFYCDESRPVRKVMSGNPVSVTPDTSIVELAQRMAEGPPKNYPVVQEGKLVGLISRQQIICALMENNEDCYIHK